MGMARLTLHRRLDHPGLSLLFVVNSRGGLPSNRAFGTSTRRRLDHPARRLAIASRFGIKVTTDRHGRISLAGSSSGGLTYTSRRSFPTGRSS